MRHAPERLGGDRAADAVEGDVDAGPEGGVDHGLGEAALAVVDRHVGAELLAERDLLGPPAVAIDRGAEGLAELDGGRADAAGAGVHQQRLAGLDAGPLDEA